MTRRPPPPGARERVGTVAACAIAAARDAGPGFGPSPTAAALHLPGSHPDRRGSAPRDCAG